MANLCGVDKVSFADRAQWTDQNMHKVVTAGGPAVAAAGSTGWIGLVAILINRIRVGRNALRIMIIA